MSRYAEALLRAEEEASIIADAIRAIPPPVVELPQIPAPPSPPAPPAPPSLVYRDYLTEAQLSNKGVVNAATPVEVDVLALIARRARNGFVYSETGTLLVSINDKSPIFVKASDFLNIGELRLEVERMRIEAEGVGDLSFRLMLV